MQENVTIPGFFFSPFNITHGNIGQRGQPFWKIRFTPRYPGEYVAVITTRDRSGSVSSERHYFTAVAKPFKGFLRVAKHQPFALELSDGSAFHAVGCNLDKYHRPSSAPPTDRLSYLLGFVNTLGEHGGNYVRFRTDLAYEAHESAPSLIAQYLGVGFYQQQIAFEIDTVLARAESVGVYVQMSLYNEDCIINDGRPDKMRFSPFLKSHGGPLKDGNSYEQFWVNQDVKALVQDKMRYYYARWGYSRHVRATLRQTLRKTVAGTLRCWSCSMKTQSLQHIFHRCLSQLQSAAA